MFCLYNLKNIEFSYRKFPGLECSSLRRTEEQEPRQIQLYGAERVRGIYIFAQLQYTGKQCLKVLRRKKNLKLPLWFSSCFLLLNPPL